MLERCNNINCKPAIKIKKSKTKTIFRAKCMKCGFAVISTNSYQELTATFNKSMQIKNEIEK